MSSYFGDVVTVRFLLQRGMAAIYLVAFLSAFNQFPALLGDKGLLPIPAFLQRTEFWRAPSLFFWHYSDAFFRTIAGLGIVGSALALFGITERGPTWVSTASWLGLWLIYLSIVNVGQTFYSFGWESMLLEAGFFTAFLGSSASAPSLIPVLILRWMLFRTEIGAGLIKLRNDACWRDLTCLYFHYETQPLPNPLSWYFHQLPHVMQRVSVGFSHFVQIIVPFGLFGPQPVSAIAGGLCILHQLLLIISGNYSWLNWLTLVLGFAAFSDGTLQSIFRLAPEIVPSVAGHTAHNALLVALLVLTVWLSIKPTLNLFSKQQLMNYSYNRFHIVNTYGAFGSMTKKRYEVVLEGTTDATVNDATTWHEYGFRAKPGPLKRGPPQIAPYHLRLDWLMWFLPFSTTVTSQGVFVPGYETWFARFVQKILEGDAATLGLLKHNPLAKTPTHVRARYYLYRYTTPTERLKTGAIWQRTLVGDYLPAVSLANFR